MGGAKKSGDIDIIICDPSNDSKIFNTLMRARAVELEYTMNEHGIYHFKNKKKGNRVDKEFITEESIFEFLGIEWREPNERIDGNSFKLVSSGGKKTAAKTAAKTTTKTTKKTALKKKHQLIKKNISD